MKNDSTQAIRDKILALIDAEFESDAAFERELEIPEKTVNNWRRGRSSSFMRMLPMLSERFGMNVGEIMDLAPRRDTSELSDDELALITLYRRTRTMPEKMRTSLQKTLDTTINMYIAAHSEMKRNARRLRAKEKS